MSILFTLLSRHIRQIGLFGGLGLCAFLLSSPAPEGLSADGWKVLAIAVLMAIWWMTEALPIAVTALVPLIAFPLLGVGDIKLASKAYASKAVMLTLGGFIIGVALQRWNLHVRIAMHIILLIGTQPKRVVAGFMLACAALSMWITNTGTSVMMLPIALSVAHLLMKESDDPNEAKRFAICLMLALAYSATMGGMMTLVGTSTNVMFKGYFEESFGLEIGFLDWMKVGVPVGLSMLVVTWWFLTCVMFPSRMQAHEGIRTIVLNKLAELGRMRSGEKRTLAVFLTTVALWVLRSEINDWQAVLTLNDASIALMGAMALFMIPARTEEPQALLRWDDTKEVPWGILLMLGGGISLAGFLNSTGVANWMGSHIAHMDNISIVLLILLVTAVIIFLSELMSNVATISAFLPVTVALSLGFGENPLLMAVPAALAASCAFMLPISTPPNAVVFGSNLLTIPQMARTGLLLNLIALIVINLVSYFLVQSAFGVTLGTLPDWAVK